MNWLQKMANQKVLIISRGPSGSGKSRMNHELSDEFSAPVFASDDFFMQTGTYEFDPRLLGKAHAWNQQRVEDSMKDELPVIIVDNTNTQFWEMREYTMMAQKYGYSVDFKEPDWNPRLKTPEGRWNVDFLEEMQNQPDREKKIPRNILEKMVERYEYNPTIESVLNSKKPERLGTRKDE